MPAVHLFYEHFLTKTFKLFLLTFAYPPASYKMSQWERGGKGSEELGTVPPLAAVTWERAGMSVSCLSSQGTSLLRASPSVWEGLEKETFKELNPSDFNKIVLRLGKFLP